MKNQIHALISTLKKVEHNVRVDQSDFTQEIISITKLSSIDQVTELRIASQNLQNCLVDKKLIQKVICELEYYAQLEEASMRSLRRAMKGAINDIIERSRNERAPSYSDSIEIECRVTAETIHDIVLENLGTSKSQTQKG